MRCNGDIFSWICDSLIVPVAQILGDSTLDRLAVNLSDRLSTHGTKTIILNGSEGAVSIGAYYGDSVDASTSTTENLIIASESVTDSPQRDLVILTGSDEHTADIRNAVVLEYGADIETLNTGLSNEIDNSNNNTLISGTALNDTITNEGSNVTIEALAGDDTIVNWDGNNPSIFSGAGNDYIVNRHGYHSTINAGEGNDTIITNGRNSTVSGGIGNNLISLTSTESGTAEGVVLTLVEGELTTVEGFKGIGNGEADTL